MNTLKQLWADGRVTIGAWTSLGSPLIAEMLGRAGFSYVCIDTQHGVNDYAATLTQLQAVDCGGTPALVRVDRNEHATIGRMLDAGADGVIVPVINSAAEARAAVAACRYPPVGDRSWGPIRSGLRGSRAPADADAHTACIVMIETADALASLDDIVAVEGVDAIYVGPADLSLSMGMAPGNRDDEPRFVEALGAIVASCVRHGVVAGIHSTDALACRRVEMGFQMVTVASDSTAINDGIARSLEVMADAVGSGVDGGPEAAGT